MYTCNYCIFQFVRIESKYFGRRIKSSKAERLKETGRGEADVPPCVKSVFLLPGPGSPAPMLPAGTSSGPIPPLSAGGVLGVQPQRRHTRSGGSALGSAAGVRAGAQASQLPGRAGDSTAGCPSGAPGHATCRAALAGGGGLRGAALTYL